MRRGVHADVVIALRMPRGIDFIVAMLAVSKAGGAFLPLDARHPDARTQQIVEGSGALLVITPEIFVELEREAAPVVLSHVALTHPTAAAVMLSVVVAIAAALRASRLTLWRTTPLEFDAVQDDKPQTLGICL